MHCEPIDCVVVRMDRRGIQRHCEGAQSVFGRSRALKIVKALGKPWEVKTVDEMKERACS